MSNTRNLEIYSNKLKDATAILNAAVGFVDNCPFCDSKPVFKFRVDEEYSDHGSLGHFANQEKCCSVMTGRNELFYCNTFRPPNYRLWAAMGVQMMIDWNHRYPNPHESKMYGRYGVFNESSESVAIFVSKEFAEALTSNTNNYSIKIRDDNAREWVAV